MRIGKIKNLGYGVSIHYNSYRKIFEVYRIGTYYPSDPNFNKNFEIVAKNKNLKKAIKKFKKISK
jgi:hypothetical protein